MDRYFESKLNHIIRHSPHGAVLTSEWLNKQGVNYKLAWWYVRSGWLERLSDKAYKRAGDKVGWMGAVAALQQQLGLAIYVGGKTALQLLGKAHFLPLAGVSIVELFTVPSVTIPRWLLKVDLGKVQFRVHKAALFNPKIHPFLGLTNQEVNGIQLQLSAPERAMFEVLYDVPQGVTFEESMQLMENLTRLRPQIIQELLEGCQSIKVKRLFLHAADHYQHEWLNDLNLKKIHLGKGKRKIGVGGHYDPKYQLSVPKLKEDR